MHVRLFVVTYKGYERLKATLTSLFESNLDPIELDVYIINNHTEFRIDPEFESRVTVMHNELRPDWSNGHLSRNWNQTLLHGFEDLSDPACDAVVAVQDDTLFREEWSSRLVNLHEEYTLVQNGLGDQFMSYRPEAVRRIGLWDERFIFGVHVRDYLYRALMYNKEDSTINDLGHGRISNPIFPDDENRSTKYLVDADPRQIDEAWDQTNYFRNIGYELLEAKYRDIGFDEMRENPIDRPYEKSYVYYPYFEKDVYDLNEKNYLWEESFDRGEAPLITEQMNIVSDQIELTIRAVEHSPIPSSSNGWVS